MYRYFGYASLRLGMFGWFLNVTEPFAQAFLRDGMLGDFAPRVLDLASSMHDHDLVHVPYDFWKSFSEIMPTADLQSAILSKLAARDDKLG